MELANMDLTQEKWLPVLLFSGARKKVSLPELLDDDIADVDYPRADFQGAAWQMLIGLLQCAVAPASGDDWEERWNSGIDPGAWAQGLRALAPALQFGEQKPAFLQSFEPLDSESGPIAGLLIDAPGGNTLKLNKDHFVKRGGVERICPHCAVMALFAVQTNSPAGGAGYRVGMRGGGPLTTLVVPRQEDAFPLWKKLWLNVLVQEEAPSPAHYPLIFPWLAPTKTSEKPGNIVTEENAHPLQAYWGMPRRIEIDFARTQAGQCDLCGEPHPRLLSDMRSKNYGVQYDGWLHPFSPYRQALKDSAAPWLALKGQPGGLSYKDWLGLMLEADDRFNKILPATVVRQLYRDSVEVPVGLWCFAWDMDNAKARCWYQHRIPLARVAHDEAFTDVLKLILPLASEALSILRSAFKSAWFEYPKEAKADFSMLDIAFWQETERDFRTLLEALIAEPRTTSADTRRALRDWERALHRYLLHAFDRDVLTNVDCPADILLRQINARRMLEGTYIKSKTRNALLALALEKKETTHV